MANLIITVISIALVAVAALMGAYYGGSAFIDGQAKAEANRLVSSAEQIAAAATLWSSNTGRQDYEDSRFNFLVTKNYLSSMPKLDTNINDICVWPNGSDNYDPCADGFTTSGKAYIAVYISAGESNRVCDQIAKMAGDPTAVPRNDGIFLPTAGRKFDCVLFDPPTEYYFLYPLN